MRKTKNMFIEEILRNTVVDRTAKEQNWAALILVLETMLFLIFCNAWIQKQLGLQEQCVQWGRLQWGSLLQQLYFEGFPLQTLQMGKHKPPWNKFSSRSSLCTEDCKIDTLRGWEAMRRRLRRNDTFLHSERGACSVKSYLNTVHSWTFWKYVITYSLSCSETNSPICYVYLHIYGNFKNSIH